MLLTRRPRAIAIAGALALLVAACGGDDAAPEPEPAAEAEEVADTAEMEDPVEEPDADEPDADEPEAQPEPAADADAWCAEAIGAPSLLGAGGFDDFDDEEDRPIDDRAIAELQAAVTMLEGMAAIAPPDIRAENELVVEFFAIILDVTETVHRAGGTEDDVDAALWDDERMGDDQILALDALFSYVDANC